MTKGVLVFAFNNESIDYIKQAKNLAMRMERFCNLPTSIVTDVDVRTTVFDRVIKVNVKDYTAKIYNNGHGSESLSFKNTARAESFDLSPYDETLVVDSDVIVCDSQLSNCFDQPNDLCMYRDAYDLAQTRNYKEFDKISETGVDFYWATCVFFRKTAVNKIFFDLVKHISENWKHYRMTYQITQPTFRNDFAFSIAAHIMNGHTKGDFVHPMPGKLFYTLDKDILVKMTNRRLTFLVDDGNNKFTPIKTKDMTIHAMNKFSLEELL